MRVIEPTVNIQLYNKSKVREGLIELNKTSNFKRERSKNGDATLSFLLPREEGIDICTEKYFKYDNQFYVLKNKNKSSQDTYSFTAYLNLEELESIVPTFESIEKTITECLQLALAGTDYTVGSCDVTKKRTIRVEQKSVRDIINQAIKTYRCYCEYDTINKVINIYENLGSYKGAFLSDELNLRELNFNENTNSFFTRIRPIGKDGLTIASVNDGSEYLENHQYSDKNITYYWKDERYTIAESLKEDAIAKLDELSKPQKSYSCKIRDLARLDPNNNSYLDYGIGDTLDLISNQDHIKDKQLVVKIIEYPLDPSQNSIEIANTYLSFEEIQQEYADNINTVNNITSDNGTVSPDAIRSSLISLINVDIQNLSAVSARIGELFTNQLRADVANINTGIVGKLLAQKIETKDLVASNVKFDIAEGGSLSLKDLLTQFLSANSTETLHLTAGNVVIDEAVIKDLIASKIKVADLMAGTINTNNFNIASEDGGISIVGSTQQFKDKNGKVRLQLGKDAEGNFTFVLVGADGTTAILNENGITKNAIPSKVIVNDMVADNANIDGSKVNIESLIECVNNNNTKTLNASKIVMDGTSQTLQASFKKMTTNVLYNQAIGTATSHAWNITTTESSGKSNMTHILYKVLSKKMKVGSKVKVAFDFTGNNLVCKDNANKCIYFQGAGNVTGWNAGAWCTYAILKPSDTITEINKHYEYTFTVDANGIKNDYWTLNVRVDRIDGDFTLSNLMIQVDEPFVDFWTKSIWDEEDSINTLQTKFDVHQGKIEQLIKDTTITTSGGTKTLKDAYNETKSTVDGTVQTVSKMETQVNSLNLTNLLRAGGGDYLNVSSSIWGKGNFTSKDIFKLDGNTNNKWYSIYNTNSNTATNKGMIYVTNSTKIKAPSDKKISVSLRYYCNDSNGKTDAINHIRLLVLQEHNNSNNFYNSYKYVDLDKTTAAKLYKGTFELNSNCTRYMIRFDLANNAIASGVTTAFRFKDIMVVNGSVPANEWSPSFKDLQVDINSIESRVSSCEVKTTDEAFTVQVQKNQNRRFNVRYIRDYCNGNTSQYSNLCNWMEIQAISNIGTNLALNKTVTSNVTVSNLSYVTNGDYKDSSKYANATSSTTTIPYVQIDLGQVYSNIDELKIWHYYLDGRIYNNTKTEVSADGTHWITLFDSAVSGTYVETIYGHSIKVNGTSFNSSKVTINELGLHVKNGAIDIQNNAGDTVFGADTNGNLDLVGNITTKSNTTGKKALQLDNTNMFFYDWAETTTRTKPVGLLFTEHDNSTNTPGLTLAHLAGSYLSLDYTDTNKDNSYYNYIAFDKYGLRGNKYPITLFEDMNVGSAKLRFGIGSWISGANGNRINANITTNEDTEWSGCFGVVKQDEDKYIFKVSPYLSGNDRILCNGNTYVDGNLIVNGNKNCIQKTEHFGDIKFYATEDMGSYLTWRPEGDFECNKIDSEGNFYTIIKVPEIVRECINTNLDYIIKIMKLSFGDYYTKTFPGYFKITSDKQMKFRIDYVKGYRKGFEEENYYNQLGEDVKITNKNKKRMEK